MTQYTSLIFKKALIKKLESFWLILAILALISSVMCIAIAFLALVLPGANLASVTFFCASIALGLAGRWSIVKLRKRNQYQHQLVV